MKILIIILILAGLTITAINGSYAAPGNVKFTVHNMSNNNNPANGMVAVTDRRFYSAQVDQVCIFCHTPHNASPSVPLWNKTMVATNFRMYTSSRTLTSTVRGSTLPTGSPSLLCLSCHDGKTAVNVLHNSNVGIDATAFGYAGEKLVDLGGDPNPYTLQDFAFGYKAPNNIGGVTGGDFYAGNNLTDDHPIGFSYTAAQLQDVDLRTKADVGTRSSNAVRFFTVGTSVDRVECSSCHDPHVNYTAAYGGNAALKPFLVMSNTGSALCLSCHNK